MLARCLLSENKREEVRIFYSYARADSGFRSLIDDVLAQFKWDVEVRTWYDGDILAGTEWEQDIFRNIDAADIILLFVTRKFFSSSYCRNVELPRALRRHEAGEATVIPILVEMTDENWLGESFSKLQVLPRNGTPVTEWSEPADAVRAVVQGIVDIIASSALTPDGRCRWQLHLEGSPDQLDDDKLHYLIRALRTLGSDETLRPLALGTGSIVLVIDSAQEGLSRFRHWYAQEGNPKLLDFPVIRVIELYGAGVQASCHETDLKGARVKEVNHESALLLPSEPFVPFLLKGIEIDRNDPLDLKFVIDSGHSMFDAEGRAAEASRLTELFLTAVAVPKDELWVNLSPDETNRMLGKSLAGTDLGRELLQSDLNLKKLASSLMHPDTETGKKYWEEVFRRAELDKGRVRRDLGSFQRVWIIPSKATVYRGTRDSSDASVVDQVIITESAVQVLCEDDYLANYANSESTPAPDSNDICTPVFRSVILPAIEKEVNEGRSFSRFRQFYCSLILAKWLKEELADDSEWKKYIDTGHPGQLLGTLLHIEPIDSIRDHLGVGGEPIGNGSAKPLGSRAAATDDQAPHDVALARAKELRDESHFVQSLAMLSELVESTLEEFGFESEITQKAMIQLGLTYRAVGRFDEAAERHREVLRLRRHILGNDHPRTLDSMVTLSDTLRAAGREKNARNLMEEADERRARTSEGFSIRENLEFYEDYMRVFRGGVFRLSRDEYRHDGETSTRICRSYFSGAVDMRSISVQRRR